MNRVQAGKEFEAQFQEIIQNALDKRAYLTLTTHATPDTEFVVTHGLGYAVNGYLVIKTDKAADVYDGTTANTDELLYLRCNVASAALRLMVF
jgi:hypothetical protein